MGLYGAGASCLFGAVGCLGVTALGYTMEPDAIPPRGQVTVPQQHLNNIPVPIGVADPTSWAQGYQDGWDTEVQRGRAKWAFIGGSTVAVVEIAAVATYFILVSALIVGGF